MLKGSKKKRASWFIDQEDALRGGERDLIGVVDKIEIMRK
jgi:hypothetical protein